MTIAFEQTPDFDGVDRPGLPASEKLRTAPLFDEFKQPLVRCSFTARHVTDMRVKTGLSQPVFSVEYDAKRSAIRFDGLGEIAVSRVDLTLEISDQVVGHLRLRRWRFLGAESSAPWDGD